jgi:protease-4
MRKGTGCLIVVGILFVLVVLLFLATFIAQQPVQNSIVEISIDANIVEERLQRFPDRFFQGEVTTVKDILDILQRAHNDSRIAGVILYIDPVSMGLAKVQEIRDAIAGFKSSGKFIFAFMEDGGNLEYFLACAAERVYLMPQGSIQLTGLASEVYFFRGMFDKLGIIPDFEHIGDYKNASDVLTRKTMSDAHREAVNAILDSYYDQFISGIAQSRKLSTAKTKDLIDKGPFLAQEAVNNGLIDKLVYKDEFLDLAKQRNKGKLPIIEGKKYLLQSSRSGAFKPKIALVYGCGSIVPGSSSYSPLTGMMMGSDTIAKAIKEARESSAIKAIIFRIDSPGGSAIASDVIWREVVLTKKVKPFIVSMSDVAGSGGYWIAMSADKIVAQPGTLTGSIGVLGGKYNIKGFYQKIGINKEILYRGKHARIFSDYQNFTDEEREIFLKGIKDIYHNFVSKVANSRNMSYEQVDEIAQGRVWTGEQGKKLGLVDELGGLNKALELAKTAANISPKTNVALVIYPKISGWSGRFLESVFINELRPFKHIDPALRMAAQFQQLQKENFYLMMPFYLKVH